jgi:hypothetical protein
LEHHDATDDHYAMVHDAARTTAIWTRWPHNGVPEVLLVLPDCPATHPAHGGCCEYEGHSGGHTWQVHDGWDPHHEPEAQATVPVRQAPDRRNERCVTN